jgi:hypothetical protein
MKRNRNDRIQPASGRLPTLRQRTRQIAHDGTKRMRRLIVVYILGVARGQVIYLDKLYSNIRSRFPKECRELGKNGKEV